MKGRIKNRVYKLYCDINCARTAIICLSELFETTVERQTLWSAVGLHGDGGYREQCGLVEGTLILTCIPDKSQPNKAGQASLAFRQIGESG